MNSVDEQNLIKMLKRHEGFSATVYKCPTGHWTIGYGHNCDAYLDYDAYSKRVISEPEAHDILLADLSGIVEDCSKNIRSFSVLSDISQAVLIDMCFSMGIGKLLSFKKMLWNFHIGNLRQAAREMLNSKWAAQVSREAELVFMTLTDEWL